MLIFIVINFRLEKKLTFFKEEDNAYSEEFAVLLTIWLVLSSVDVTLNVELIYFMT